MTLNVCALIAISVEKIKVIYYKGAIQEISVSLLFRFLPLPLPVPLFLPSSFRDIALCKQLKNFWRKNIYYVVNITIFVKLRFLDIDIS